MAATPDTAAREAEAIAALDPAALARDLSALVRIPSLTGAERPAAEAVAAAAQRMGLDGEVQEHDLAALRSHPGHPGEEAERDELVGALATLRGSDRSAPRLALNGHVDVVGPGAQAWARDPYSGDIEDGWLHGRGAVDMKAGVVAALHALAAVGAAAGPLAGDVVLQAVPSEEDGGLGTFAALEADSRFAAAVIPEPTAFAVCCAHAGALTFAGVVPGRSAHAAVRLEGESAIDRYLSVHLALRAHESDINRDVAHPLMAALDLPYPISVGRLRAGEWSAQVPDRLVFEGRLGVRVGEDPADARAALRRRLQRVCPDLELTWTGGQFAPADTPADHPLVGIVRGALAEETGMAVPLVGVPYGADMRHFTARGIPTVMAGTGGLALAHAVDERVSLADAEALARMLVRVILRRDIAAAR